MNSSGKAGKAGTMSRSALLWVVFGAIALIACCCGGAFLGGTTLMASCGSVGGVDPDSPLPAIESLNPEQVRHAAIIIRVGQDKKFAQRGWIIAVATAMQESTLHNYGHLGDANDHDSLGLFQQRPSQGWGSSEEILDPYYAAGKFYDKLARISGWEQMPLTRAAQAVQISAYPEAYAKWEPLATTVVSTLSGSGRQGAPGNAFGTCPGAGPSGWVVPVNAPITSAYRSSERPTHDGVDLGAARGAAIHAAAAGTVTLATCNAHTQGGGYYSCDVDGSVSILGCGWYVEITHAERIITRYCHMGTKPAVIVGQKVNAGDVLGQVGSSGNSSGPHLHFEVHLNNDGSSGGATSPVEFMAARGAPLPTP
ncbi:M23 family metallopeptidase [Phytomonospora sp. NPDC050363]|uniref:M23 family metallopeptidase n=1 Tax=Phytomonospora sp. NPDC050363 TaxID=3155642 RepID=UPI00340C42D2